jgi:hypothetical protein
MVNINGGPHKIGLDGLLWYLVQNFVQQKGLFDGWEPKVSPETCDASHTGARG